MSDIKGIVKDFLNRHRKAVFATASGDLEPHASLMLYAIDDDLHFYFGTRKSFRKYERLLKNPKIALAVIEEVLDPQQVVEVEGIAEEIPAEKTKETHDFFESKNPSTHYVKDAPDMVMFKIIPTRMRWLDASSGELTMQDVDCGN